jgi:hypothetical protein
VFEHEGDGGGGERVCGGDVEGKGVAQVLGGGGQQRVRHGAADIVHDDV